jgi:hypothetical protein
MISRYWRSRSATSLGDSSRSARGCDRRRRRRRRNGLQLSPVKLISGPAVRRVRRRARSASRFFDFGCLGDGGDLVSPSLHRGGELRACEVDLLGQARHPRGDRRAGAVVLDGDVASGQDRVAPALEDQTLAILAPMTFLSDERYRELGAPPPYGQVRELLAVAALVSHPHGPPISVGLQLTRCPPAKASALHPRG